MPDEEEVGSEEAGDEEAEEEEEGQEGEEEQEDVNEGDGSKQAADAKAEAENEADKGTKGGYRGSVDEVLDSRFDMLTLPSAQCQEVQDTWSYFLRSAESREAAGEAIYAALFDSAPSLQSLFKTPRAVMAMRFMNGLNNIIMSLHDPKACKTVVETLGFQHLDLEVTIPRVGIFRDAIVDLLAVELGQQMTPKAKSGWLMVLNWVGGAYIYVRLKYTDRLKILASSWATANKKQHHDVTEQVEEGEEKEGEEKEQGFKGSFMSGEVQNQEVEMKAKAEAEKKAKAAAKKKQRSWGFTSQKSKSEDSEGNAGHGQGEGARTGDQSEGTDFKNTSVPTTYNEMFMFNAAVMGFGKNTWMNEILMSFDTIVTNVSNSYRLQEECDVLSLRIAKYKGTINLPEYKAVMLASLRSLVPKDWNSDHEVAWSWLWENVERILKGLMGKPAAQEKALEKLWKSLDESAQAMVRREVYSKFFTIAPAGQDYFKQSTTRLHFIADRIVAMTLEIYVDPKKMVEDISALGLRHVGYGIPTDLFGPFVTACVQVVRSLTDDDLAEESFRWALSLISRILTRVINEGSTIVMKAINTNSAKQLKRAVGCAPRGRRALWMLNIQVGTQSISPLLWAIETGSLEAAKAIIMDLLTIRADRDQYYYGMDTMFERHGDIIKRLCVDAPALLPNLLDGLIWRSRLTENGLRRVNYYVKHLILDLDGQFSKALEWITDSRDPKIVCHPVVVLVTDIVWSGVAFRIFLVGKSWFIFTLVVFLISQSILHHVDTGDNSLGERIAIFACRVFIYIFSLGQFAYSHITNVCKDYRAGNIVKIGHIPVPEYLVNLQDLVNLLLMIALILMLATEPILRCLANQTEQTEDNIFTETCEASKDVAFPYSIISMIAMLCYYVMVIDISVLSTRISAFVLVCTRVKSEVALFLVALFFFVLTFSCAISALEHDNADFQGIHKGGMSLLEITLGMYSGHDFSEMHKEPALMFAVVGYVIVTIVFLLNLLIAQLNCSYASTYQDMLGFARLNRAKIVVESMPSVSNRRWEKFVTTLRLSERLEFNEGDIGLSGGIQVTEVASLNVTTVDMIKRFGGSTSPSQPWPEEVGAGEDEDDRFERLEKMIGKAMKRSDGTTRKHKGGGGSSSGMGGTGSGTSSSHGGGDKEESDKSSGEDDAVDAGK